MTAGPIPLLDYATRPRRRRRVWVALLGILCAIIVACGCRWREPLYRRAQLLYRQHRCMTHDAPVDQVVLDTDVAAWEHWRGKSGYGVLDYAGSSCVPALRYVCYNPDDLGRFLACIPPQQGGTLCSTAFEHGLRRPDGKRRLVLVLAGSFGERPGGSCVAFSSIVWEPATPFGDGVPKVVQSYGDHLFGAVIPQGHEGRLLAGQPDPNDASRFGITLLIDGVPHRFDGELRDDDSLRMTARDGTTNEYRYWAPSDIN